MLLSLDSSSMCDAGFRDERGRADFKEKIIWIANVKPFSFSLQETHVYHQERQHQWKRTFIGGQGPGLDPDHSKFSFFRLFFRFCRSRSCMRALLISPLDNPGFNI